jgi:hypothetical protein
MISKRLTRRVEDLDSDLLTAVGEPLVVRLNFVDRDGTVVDPRKCYLMAEAVCSLRRIRRVSCVQLRRLSVVSDLAPQQTAASGVSRATRRKPVGATNISS